jgi:hypothetical protein
LVPFPPFAPGMPFEPLKHKVKENEKDLQYSRNRELLTKIKKYFCLKLKMSWMKDVFKIKV